MVILYGDPKMIRIKKVIGKDEPKCGMDKLVEKMADEEAEYWEMKAEVHFGI